MPAPKAQASDGRLWALNLDAEYELSGHTLPRRARERLARLVVAPLPFMKAGDRSFVVLAQNRGCSSHGAPWQECSAQGDAAPASNVSVQEGDFIKSPRQSGVNPACFPQKPEAAPGAPAPFARQLLRFQVIGGAEHLPSNGDLLRAASCPLLGAAWCPTTSALRALESAGARLPPAPPMDVLARVNHRRFALEVEASRREKGDLFARGACIYCEREERCLRYLQEPGDYLAKRPLAMAGRGMRRLRGGELGKGDRAWLRASLRRYGGLLIEPRVAIEAEFSIHGFVTSIGRYALSGPVVQNISAQGSYRGARMASIIGCPEASLTTTQCLSPEEARALADTGESAARALFEAGYFGPFGVDAFRYRSGGASYFRPLSEINARYTMAWGLAPMGPFNMLPARNPLAP